jgi:hypothetical protein
MQIVPPSEQLVADLPSGREYHKPQAFMPPVLDDDVLAKMRAPPDPQDVGASYGAGNDDSGSEDEREQPPGAFPGTQRDYVGTSSYY